MTEAENMELLMLLREAVPLLKQMATAVPAASVATLPRHTARIKKQPPTPSETLKFLEGFFPGISAFVPTA